jgi:hypothetical protein
MKRDPFTYAQLINLIKDSLGRDIFIYYFTRSSRAAALQTIESNIEELINRDTEESWKAADTLRDIESGLEKTTTDEYNFIRMKLGVEYSDVVKEFGCGFSTK